MDDALFTRLKNVFPEADQRGRIRESASIGNGCADMSRPYMDESMEEYARRVFDANMELPRDNGVLKPESGDR